MKISEAIRKGNVDFTQERITVLRLDKDHNFCGCAIGCALVGAVGKNKLLKNRDLHTSNIFAYFHFEFLAIKLYDLFREIFNAPDTLLEEMMRMNDTERLTLEQIAKRLEERGL